jgi:hypothetical protein
MAKTPYEQLAAAIGQTTGELASRQKSHGDAIDALVQLAITLDERLTKLEGKAKFKAKVNSARVPKPRPRQPLKLITDGRK